MGAHQLRGTLLGSPDASSTRPALSLGASAKLFAGAERAAVLYTLIETAKLNGVAPEAYLRNVITGIADHPAKRFADLLP